MRVEPHTTVGAFFHEQVGRAMQSQGLRASEMAGWYLVNLLVENVRAGPDLGEPMAIRLHHARQGNPTLRAHKLRELGDAALYLSGFFGDSLQRRLVAKDYYIAIGVSAYGELESLVRLPRTAGHHADVFAELRDRFGDFVEVLSQVSEVTVAPQDLHRLLQRWLQTRSRHLLHRLAAQGVVIAPGSGRTQ